MKRSVLITGAAGGIGRALCHGFKAAGWRVVATDTVPASKVGDVYLRQDLGELKSKEVLREFAGKVRTATRRSPLAAIINNAAIQQLNPTPAVQVGEWETSLTINLVAPFLLVQEFLPELEKSRGAVINIASIHAALTKPGFVVYATTKAALAGMTRALAVDLGARVRVNAICPAAISTPMLEAGFEGRAGARRELDEFHPVGRIGAPEEVARLAVFMASGEVGFLQGSCVGLDGGISGRLHDPA